MFDAGDIELRFDYDAPEVGDISRCLRTLYATRAGSQPLDRGFGLDWGFIDKPLPVAQQEFAFEVIRKTREYEPRVKVEEVTYSFDGEEGRMKPVIRLGKGGIG